MTPPLSPLPSSRKKIKELKIVVTDVKALKHAKVLDGFATPQRTPSPKARKLMQRPLRATTTAATANNRTLDAWVSKSPKPGVTGAAGEEVDPLAIDKPVRTTRASIKGAATEGTTLENGDA